MSCEEKSQGRNNKDIKKSKTEMLADFKSVPKRNISTYLIAGIASFLLTVAAGVFISIYWGNGNLAKYASLISDSPYSFSKDSTALANKNATNNKPVVFYPLRPAFVVNLPSQNQIRHLQVRVDLMTRSEKTLSSLSRLSPIIKSNLVDLFSTQKITEITNSDGKKSLKTKALATVNNIMKEHAPGQQVEDILLQSLWSSRM